MKKVLVFIVSFIIIFALITFFFDQSNTSEPDVYDNGNINYQFDDAVTWLAEHWDADVEEWRSQANADDLDMETWLRDHPLYGEGNRIWSIFAAIDKIASLSVEASSNADDEAAKQNAAEAMAQKLLSDLSKINGLFSFQILDYKNVTVVNEYIEDKDIWVSLLSADINYAGIILPDGICPQNEYYKMSLGTFEISYQDGIYTWHHLYSDDFSRVKD